MSKSIENNVLSKRCTSGLSRSEEYTSILEETTRGAFFLFSGGFIATALSALTGILIARLLGPEQYGIYSLAFTIPGFLMVFTGFGVNSALTRYISSLYNGEKSSRLASMIKIGTLFIMFESILVFILGYLFINELTRILLGRADLADYSLILLPTIILQAVITASIGVLLGFSDALRVTYINIIQQVFRLLIAPLLVVTGFGLVGALYGNTIAYGLACIASLIYLYKYYVLIRDENNNEPATKILLEMVSYGIPLYISSVITALIDTYRNALLARIADDYTIGSFSAAFRFVTLITIIMAPISTMLFPAFSKLNNNRGELRKMLVVSIKYSSILVVPATVFYIVMSRELVAVLFGRDYLYLTPRYFSLLSANYLYVAVGYMVLGSFFSGVGDTRVNLEASVIYAGLFTLLAIPLARLLGVDGLVYSMIIGNGVSILYSLYIAHRKYSAKPDYKSSLAILTASLVAGVPVYTLSSMITFIGVPLNLLKLVVGGLVYLFIYTTLLPLLGVMKQGDLEFIVNAFSKIKPLKPFIVLIAKYEEKLIGKRVFH